MDSNPRKHHRPSGPRRRKPGSGARRRSAQRVPSVSSSFAPPPTASRAIVRLPVAKTGPVTGWGYLLGLVGVLALIMAGGGHNAFALGLAMLLPGAALIIRPPEKSLGRWVDFGMIGLLLVLLLAFVPQFYWPEAPWRAVAVDSFGIALPQILSVQPWMSAEAWLLALGGFAWLYAASAWSINYAGRRRFLFVFALLIGVMAGIVAWGNWVGARYPGAESATAFSFFPNRNQTANFLAVGGVVAFAYAMEGVCVRRILPLIGFFASALCLVALVLGVSRAGVLLIFVGVALWFVLRLRSRSVPGLLKLGFPLMVVVMSVVLISNERTVQRIVDFATADSAWEDEFRTLIYRDTVEMISAAPVSGFGLGTFSAVFPQYRDASANHQRVVHPESDLFWLGAEGGLLALVFFAVFLLGYAWRCRGLTEGGSGLERMIAVSALGVFLMHALVDVPGHRPGTVYFAILLAAFALPKKETARASWSPRVWRVLGSVLCFIGFIWILAATFRLPLHSTVAIELQQEAAERNAAVGDFERAREDVEKWLNYAPLEWRAFFHRAQLILAESGDRSAVAADFRRARFVEPILGVVTFEEGRIWLPYDQARAIAAWRETIFREIDGKDGVLRRMIDYTRPMPKALKQLARMSEIDPLHRSYLLTRVDGEMLRDEIRIELAKDPQLAGFSKEQRGRILKQWIKAGDIVSAEEFLEANAHSVAYPWWYWSMLYKEQANFEEAVQTIRKGLEVPSIPDVSIDDRVLTRLTREFVVAPKDVMKGTALLSHFVKNKQYDRALPVIDGVLEGHKPPIYLYYWRAECLYQIKDYIESWYAFKTYLKELGIR